MTQIATGRLIDASAALEPADRALLNLWVHRGLDDDALARLSHVDPEAIAARRAKITARLSETLGLPPASVDDALAELAAAARDAPPAGEPVEATNGSAPEGVAAGEPEAVAAGEAPAAGGDGARPEPEVVVAAEPEGAAAGAPAAGGPEAAVAGEPDRPEPAADPSTRRGLGFSRRTWIGLVIVAVVLAVVVIVALASADGSHGRLGGGSGSTPAPTPSAPAAPTPTPTSPTPARAAPVRRSHRPPTRRSHRHAPTSPKGSLVALPGGPVTAGGTVAIVGSPSHPRLQLALIGLPAVPGGYYEVWLYNSILDAVPLTRISAPATRLTVGLPPNYRRYAWIDVSFQPTGTINNSGESVLRAVTPK